MKAYRGNGKDSPLHTRNISDPANHGAVRYFYLYIIIIQINLRVSSKYALLLKKNKKNPQQINKLVWHKSALS